MSKLDDPVSLDILSWDRMVMVHMDVVIALVVLVFDHLLLVRSMTQTDHLVHLHYSYKLDYD